MASTSLCSFCDVTIVNKQQIIENEYARVLLPLKPVTNTHILITPKRHVTYITELSSEEFISIQGLLKTMLDTFHDLFNTQGYHIMNNNDPLADQRIPHVHFHVFYRSENDISPFDILSKKAPRQELTNEDWYDLIKRIRASAQTNSKSQNRLQGTYFV